jgi:hypothetical protein
LTDDQDDAFGFPYDQIPKLNKSITTTQFLRPKGEPKNQAVAITESKVTKIRSFEAGTDLA